MIKKKRIAEIFLIMNLAQYFINLLLHLIGLFALYYYKKRTNQNVVMSLLSLNEIILIIAGIICQTWEQLRFLPLLWYRVAYVIKEMAIYQLVSLMYMILIDRLVCVIDPLKYKSRMTSTRLKLSALFTLLVSLATAVFQATHAQYKEKVCSVFIAIAVVHFILATYTYIRIFISVRKSRNQFGTPKANANNDSKDFRKRFLVPGVIVTNFVVFYIIPYSVYRFTHRSVRQDAEMEVDDYVFMKISRFLTVIGLGADPVTYVLLTKHYRDIVREKCVKCMHCFVRRHYVVRDDSLRSTTTNRGEMQ